MRKRIVAATLVSASLLVAACGGDDGDSSEDTSAADDTAAATTADGGTDSAACDGTERTEPLKIGFAADFSEVGGASDVPASEAMKFTIDQINASGGAAGTPVELTVKNIDGDAARTQQAAEELLESGVSAILGPPFINYGGPLLNVTQGQVPVISVASTDPNLAGVSEASFLAGFAAPRQDGAAAELAVELGATTAITFSSPDDPYFTNNPLWFGEAFAELGGEVMKDFTYSLADSDFSSQVNEIAAMDPQPDVLYTAMIMPLIGTLLGQLKGAGVDDIIVIGSDAFDATGVVAAGDDAEGVYYTTHVFPEPGSKFETFINVYEAAQCTPIETITFGALGDDAIRLIVAACTAAQSSDPAAITAALKEIEGFEGLTGTITYKGTNGAPVKPVTIVKVESGAPTFVKNIDPAVVPEP
jgi:branched-chain amino acid transport system substrate-binding protein